DAELDRTAAHFTVFYVLALTGRQVDAGFEALAAIRALYRHELLELRALADARLEYRLQPIELIDIPLLAAGDAPGEGFELRRAAAIVHAAHSTRGDPFLAARRLRAS